MKHATTWLGSLLLGVGVLASSCKNAPQESMPTSKSPSELPAATTAPADSEAEPTPSKPQKDLPMVEIPNAVKYKHYLVGGQPTPEQYKELAQEGYKTVVNLRPHSEPGAATIQGDVAATGMTYIHIPIANAGDLTKENAQRLADALAQDPQAVVHCGSGNRVGALIALKEHWVDGVDASEALQHGKEAGLTGLEGAVSKLLEQQKESTP